MRHFIGESAETSAVGAVDVARWEQYGLDGLLPFQAMWYTVRPDSSSPRDCHPEMELSVVLSGTAFVEAAEQISEVRAGSAFLLDGQEAHIIHNRSAETPLSVFTTYWMPLDAAAAASASAAAAEEAQEGGR
jgi:mannose-6-phosphate isomerase-like protein (cupin superfamily)